MKVDTPYRLASDGAALGVLVTRGCGAVEVRVSGPRATLTLFFDQADLQPADVRSVVRAAVARYRSSLLGHQPRDRGAE